MLEALEVQNLAVIESATLEFAPGLNVLTGETGAGKSLLVDALALLLGAKADPGLIRPGAEAALVAAWIDGKSYSRRIGSRSTPRIAGELVTLGELAEAVAEKIALYAQHAAQTLTRRETQRRILDARVPEALLTAYRETFEAHRRRSAELVALRQAAREREHKLDLLRFQVQEIAAAGLTPGEDEELYAERERLRHLDLLRERLAEAAELLAGEADAVGAVGRAAAAVEAAARHDPELAPLARDLENAEAALSALARELEDRLLGLEADPERLAEVESRLAQIERLKRKYGDTIEAILAYRERAERELGQLESSEERIAELEAELKRLTLELRERGRALSQARRQAKEAIEAGVQEELAALGMPGARLVVELVPLPEPGPHGLEEVRFLLRANPGLPPAPLEKAASGGELSRTLLALLLTSGFDSGTVVLDEIDTGVGGEAARALAERLARLARGRQVIVVTHLPQIAARAERHFKVEKEKDRAFAERLEGEARVREIARMLSGGYEPEALAHARALLER